MNYLDHLHSGILRHWMEHARDRELGGFYGGLSTDWKPDKSAPKGLVQHARFMWAFSAAARRACTGEWAKLKTEYKAMADHAKAFLLAHFCDHENGGWYFTVKADGSPLDTRKHAYPHSFVVYAFSEYARAFKSKESLDMALETFKLFDKQAHDDKYLGYNESFSVDWQPIDQHEDLGIDGKRKTMNSHIHWLEALTALHGAMSELGLPHGTVGVRLNELVDVCAQRVFNSQRASLDLFFERDWERLDSLTSYGHDIELSWLIDEAAEVLGRAEDVKEVSLKLARNTIKGLDAGQGLNYDGDPSGAPIDLKRVWWVQAEALVGFMNAYRMSGDKAFLNAFKLVEEWVFERQADKRFGDWHEEIDPEGNLKGLKGHLWKEPYHQSRACMEVHDRQ